MKLQVKEFFQSFVSQAFPRQAIDLILQEADGFMAVASDPLSFRDKPSEQPIVAFIRASHKGGVRVSEGNLCITDLKR